MRAPERMNKQRGSQTTRQTRKARFAATGKDRPYTLGTYVAGRAELETLPGVWRPGASGQSALRSVSWVRVRVSAPPGVGRRCLCVLKYVSERPAPVPSSPLPDRTSGPGTIASQAHSSTSGPEGLRAADPLWATA